MKSTVRLGARADATRQSARTGGRHLNQYGLSDCITGWSEKRLAETERQCEGGGKQRDNAHRRGELRGDGRDQRIKKTRGERA